MRTIFILSSLIFLAACAQTVPPAPLQALKFTGQSYTLNVAEVNVASDYKSPKRPPNVEYLADVSPAEAVRQWAGTHLTAAGHSGSVEVDIQDASIIRKELPKKDTGITGMFTTEQTEQYDGTLEVVLKIYNAQSALPVARLDVKANQSLTLPENATPLDREHAYHNVTVNLMKALEPQLDSNIHQYFGKYLL